MTSDTGTFAAGCFWSVEAAFREVDGVLETTAGYTGGWWPNPTFDDLCTGATGHAEAVRVRFDPAMLTYRDLVEVFWSIHDPTQVGHQGFDVGEQYRSVIFTHGEYQERVAHTSRTDQQQLHRRRIATQIVRAGRFYAAEPEHQRFYERDVSGPVLADLASWLGSGPASAGGDHHRK
jgi:peptide-methionine (S)-S-oxide reductase